MEARGGGRVAAKGKARSRKGMKGQADKLFSLIVRSAGSCARCGRTWNLQCAHILSRSYSSIRWDEANAVCLCKRCHMFFTNRPVEWEDWIAETHGPDRIPMLKEKTRQALAAGTKPDYEEILDRLERRHVEEGTG